MGNSSDRFANFHYQPPHRFDLSDLFRLLVEALVWLVILAGAAVFWLGPRLIDAAPAGLLPVLTALPAGALYLLAARAVFWLSRRALAAPAALALVIAIVTSVGGFAALGLVFTSPAANRIAVLRAEDTDELKVPSEIEAIGFVGKTEGCDDLCRRLLLSGQVKSVVMIGTPEGAIPTTQTLDTHERLRLGTKWLLAEKPRAVPCAEPDFPVRAIPKRASADLALPPGTTEQEAQSARAILEMNDLGRCLIAQQATEAEVGVLSERAQIMLEPRSEADIAAPAADVSGARMEVRQRGGAFASTRLTYRATALSWRETLWAAVPIYLGETGFVFGYRGVDHVDPPLPELDAFLIDRLGLALLQLPDREDTFQLAFERLQQRFGFASQNQQTWKASDIPLFEDFARHANALDPSLPVDAEVFRFFSKIFDPRHFTPPPDPFVDAMTRLIARHQPDTKEWGLDLAFALVLRFQGEFAGRSDPERPTRLARLQSLAEALPPQTYADWSRDRAIRIERATGTVTENYIDRDIAIIEAVFFGNAGRAGVVPLVQRLKNAKHGTPDEFRRRSRAIDGFLTGVCLAGQRVPESRAEILQAVEGVLHDAPTVMVRQSLRSILHLLVSLGRTPKEAEAFARAIRLRSNAKGDDAFGDDYLKHYLSPEMLSRSCWEAMLTR